MSDLIDRQAAIDAICLSWCVCQNADCKHHFDPDVDEYYWCDGCSDVEELKNIPSAEPEYDLDGYSSRLWKAAYERGKQDAEQERKTGRWVATPSTYHYCSLCRMAAHLDYYGNEVTSNFCPNCGAQMVEDDPSHPFADDVMMGERITDE